MAASIYIYTVLGSAGCVRLALCSPNFSSPLPPAYVTSEGAVSWEKVAGLHEIKLLLQASCSLP